MSRTLRIARVLTRVAALEDRIQVLAGKYPQVPLETIRDLTQVDPSGPKGAYLEWLVRRIKENNIRWPEDRNRVVRVLGMYQDLKQKPRYFKQYDISPDINRYTLQDLERACRKVHGDPDPALERVADLPKGASVFYHNPLCTVIRVGGPGVDPQDAIDASCFLGRGTSWCTREAENAQSYLERGPLYVIVEEGVGPVAQYDPVTGQLMDTEDEPLPVNNPDYANEMVTLFNAPLHLDGELTYYIITNYRYREDGLTLQDTPFRAADASKSANASYYYALYIRKGRVPEAETSILTQEPLLAIAYSRHVLKGRWPEFEQTAETIMGRFLDQVIHGASTSIYANNFGKWKLAITKYRSHFQIDDWPVMDWILESWDRATNSDYGHYT